MKHRKRVLIFFIMLSFALSSYGCLTWNKDHRLLDREDDIAKISVTPDIPKFDPLLEEIVMKPQIQEKGPRCIVYFTSWSQEKEVSVSDIDGNLLTHVNYAFAHVSEDGEVMMSNREADLKQLKQLKEDYPHMKVFISIGGWGGSANFSDVAADMDKRNRFAETAAELVSIYGLDGVDIDWEYPVEGGYQITHRPEDGVNYTLLTKAVRKALNTQGAVDGKNYQHSIAARASICFIQDANLVETMQYIDFINLMTYDYHGGWEEITGFHTPLYHENNAESIDASVRAYLEAGIDPADINLGLAFYGRGWTHVASRRNNGVNQPAIIPSGDGFGVGTWEAGTFDAWDLIENYEDNNGFTQYYNIIAQCPYVFDGATWIGYDNTKSIKVKTSYAIEQGLGGVVCWEFAGDKYLTLQKTIAKTLDIDPGYD